MPSNHVVHLVLTGGPGAGKTSALSYLTRQLTDRGWRVLTVPEAATVLITGGLTDLGLLAGTDRAAYLNLQRQLVGLQVDLRHRYQQMADAVPQPKVVVIHDRGVADNAAYMTDGEYTTLLTGLGLDPVGVFNLYDTVIHLRSAAVPDGDYDGAAYTCANNTARTETPQAAAALDAATLAGWVGHPHLVVIGSGETFADKLDRALTAVLAALGDPEPRETERKFALTAVPNLNHPTLAAAARVDIEQVYLPNVDGVEHRVRARTLAGVTSYVHTTKKDVGARTRVEVETPVSADTYQLLAAMRDRDTAVVRKRRHLFMVGNQRFELDELREPHQAWVAEVELVDPADPVAWPDFLPAAVEVTDDPAWRNRALAAAGAAPRVVADPR